jgi:hypothetical protein
MTLIRFRDFCIDANDVELLGGFWARALGLELVLDDDGDAHLEGPTPQHRVWINRVPERKTVKHRIHLDVHAASIAEHQAWGARVIDGDSFPWTVMADPEGGEYCAFVRDVPPPLRLYELAVDATHPETIATWWGDLLGAVTVHDERGFSSVSGIAGAPFEELTFAAVPEPKTVKNRIHIDVTTPDLDALVAAGATIIRRRDDEIRWHVLADPEGNELCAFVE